MLLPLHKNVFFAIYFLSSSSKEAKTVRCVTGALSSSTGTQGTSLFLRYCNRVLYCWLSLSPCTRVLVDEELPIFVVVVVVSGRGGV